MTTGLGAGLGACVLGAAGFAAGFFGPIALNPSANQGPLMGLFITGPGGALLGAMLGMAMGAAGVAKWAQVRVLAAVALAGTLVILYFCLPAPQFRGNIVDVSFDSCVSPRELKAEALASWDKRIAGAPWGTPREGWREGFEAMVAADPGVVAGVKTRRAVGHYENRKPWDRGTYAAGKAWWVAERYFLRGKSCADVLGTSGVFVTSGEDPGKDWPTRRLSVFLGLQLLRPASPEEARLLAAAP